MNCQPVEAICNNPLSGTKLLTKKVAPRRQIPPPVNLLFYVLMCRSHIDGPAAGREEIPSTAHWRSWLEKREEEREIGHRVSAALRQRYDKEVLAVRHKQMELEGRIKRADEVLAVAKELGIEYWWGLSDLIRKMRPMASPLVIDENLLFRLQDAERAIGEVLKKIDEAKKKVV